MIIWVWDIFGYFFLVLAIISHSASKSRAKFIFGDVVPRDIMEDAVVVDIGSRLGVLCYAAYFLTNAKKIIGIELNKEFCDLQTKVVEKFALGDRIQVSWVHYR